MANKKNSDAPYMRASYVDSPSYCCNGLVCMCHKDDVMNIGDGYALVRTVLRMAPRG